MSVRPGLGLVALLALSSCATRHQTESEASALVPTARARPVAVEAPDDGRVEISGHLRAHDGTALRKAEVLVRRADFREPLATVAVDDEGRFRVDVAPGVYTLLIAAVDHRRVLRTTVVTDDLRVEGRLGTYDHGDPGDALAMHGELVDAAGAVIGRGPTSAARIADRAYRVDLSGMPPEAVALRYQLAAGGGTTNGPLADRYESDGGGDFWSIVDVSGKDALELDLRALPERAEAPQLQWTGETEPTAALLGFRERWLVAIDDLRARMPRKDGKIATMTDELRAEAATFASKARAEVDAVADPATRALLRMEHLSLFGMFLGTMGDAAALREEVMGILEPLSPTDPHLPLLLNLDNVLYRVRQNADDEEVLARTEAWLERCAREHPEPSMSLDALQLLLDTADQRHDDARMAELYPLVLDARFEGTYGQTSLKQRHDPDRILMRGKPFPAFDFEALGGGDGTRITSTDRAGRLYLLEFWATWCGPCVGEMPKLHAAYAAINGAKPGKGGGEKGLRRLAPAKRPRVEFVFVSLDDDPKQVEAFRQQHWSMPWTHAFVGRSGEPEAMQHYGFSGVPTAVLVDETGTILEVGNPLRHDALVPTLERVLAERSATAPRR